MPKILPKQGNLISIGEASEILGVSIDTIRRWDKSGILHSTRPDGKNRFFSLNELEEIKFNKPFSISEAANHLRISQSTLRRLETKGIIKPERNSNGERVYNRASIEAFLNSEYFIKQKTVQDKILDPVKKVKKDSQKIRENTSYRVVGAIAEKNSDDVTKLYLFKRFILTSIVFATSAFAFIVFGLAFSFLVSPEKTAKVFGYTYKKPVPTVISTIKSPSVLGDSTQKPGGTVKFTVGTALNPISKISLQIVKAINPTIYNSILTPEQVAGTVNNTNVDLSQFVTLNPDGTITGLKLPKPVINNNNITVSSESGSPAVEVLNGGGIIDDSGLSLLRSCSSNQVLSWNGSAWDCADQTGSGGGSFTETDTLATVTARGAITSTDLTLGNVTFSPNSSLVIGNFTSDPVAPVDGTIWYNSISGSYKIREGGITKVLCNTTDAGCGSGGGGGVSTIKEGGSTIVTSATALNFAGNDFVVTDNGAGQAGIAVDYPNSKLVRSDQNETISGNWTFTNGLILGSDTITDITGSGLSDSGGTLNVSGLTVSNLASANISQFTNNSGFITSSSSDTLTNKSISGASNTITNIGNSSLTNSSLTVTAGTGLTGGGLVSLGGSVTLNAAQDIATSASPTFAGLTLSNTTNQLVLGTTNTVTISSIAPASSRTYTLPDFGSNDTFTGIAATQTLTNKTISGSSNTLSNIGNGSLTNSSVTINSAGVLTGGGSVSLGGTLTLTATEADTLASVTGRGATTSTDLTLGNVSLSAGKALVLGIYSSDPVSPTDGTIWYNSVSGKYKIREGGATKVLCNTTDLGCGSGGGGVSTIKEGGSNVVTSATAMNFTSADFAISDETGGQAGIAIDYSSSKITRSDQAESVTGVWTFTNGLAIGSDTITDITGSGLSDSGGTLNVSGLTTSNLASANISQFTNDSGFITASSTDTLTNKTISGSSNTLTNIGNSSLTNSSITINSAGILSGGAAVSLGGSVTLTATEADTLSSVTGRGAATSTALTFSNTSPFTLSGASPTITVNNGDLTLDLTKNATNTLVLVNSTSGKTADLNLSDGVLKTGNTTRLDNSGNILNTTIDTATNTISGLTNSNLSGTAGITNVNLANSSVTINSSGILTGGGAVSLGGTLNLVATEADTLASVTGRGATSSTALTLSNTTNNISAGTLSLTLGSDATGDLFYRGSGGSFTRLGIGSGTQVLGVSAGIPSWVSTPSCANCLLTTGAQTIATSGAATTTDTFNVTNTASSGTNTSNNLTLGLIGTDNAGGSNTLNALNLSNVTAHTNNTYNGLNFGTGYTNFITSPTINISSAGLITGASGNISQFTNDSSFITASSTDTLTNKSISGASNTITNIGNGSLTNSSITINSSGILTGGGSVSLGGSLTLTATEADTLSSITGRGATTSTGLTLSSASPLTLSNSAPVITLGTADADGTLTIKDSNGTPHTLLSLVDNGTTGTLTVANLTGTGNITGFTIDGGSNTITNIGNGSLTNSSITFAGDSGSGARALGQTLTIAGAGINTTAYSGSTVTITGTEADTLASVTGRGATTSTALTLSSASNNIAAGTLTLTLGSDATGDLFYRGSGGSFTRLGVGSGTQVLGVSGGLPAWVATSACATCLLTTGGQTTSTSGTATTTDTFNVTNSGSSGTNTSNNLTFGLTGTDNAGGSNTLNSLNFSNVTAHTNNTYNGLTFGTGYTNFLNTPTIVIAGTGAITGATIAAGSNTISGITATNLTAGDFSSKINSGTYSINISGTAPAGTLTGATLNSTVTASSLTSVGTLTGLTVSGQITSTATTGTAPFVIASTTNVANLNASFLNGATFAAPGAIGSGTPSTASFTTLSSAGTTNLNTSGTAATSIGNGTGTITLTLGSDATGDLFYRSSGGTVSRLAVGSGSQVLGISAGIPGWVSVPGCSTCLLTTGGQTTSTSGTATTTDTFNVTNSGSSGTNASNNITLGLTGTDNAGGANTLNALNFSTVTAHTNNTYNGLAFGTGYTNFLTTPTINITSAGLITGASGNISQFTNNSNYLTGNQSITLSGDVSGSGTTAITTTIGVGKVTSGMILDNTIAGADLATNISFNTTGAIGLNGGFTSAQTLASNNASEGSITPTANLSSTGTVNGLTITPTKSGTAAANTYTINAFNGANVAGSCPVGATCVQNGINLGTGYTNFLKTASIVIDGSGAITGSTIAAGSNTITGITNANLSGTAGITNANLANSSVTINSSGILTGGGAVSLGGTLNLVATEADTLASVTGRGATTATALTLSSSSNNISAGTLALTLGSDATGDIFYRSSGGNIARLAIGSGSQVLGISAGIPGWVSVPGCATCLLTTGGQTTSTSGTATTTDTFNVTNTGSSGTNTSNNLTLGLVGTDNAGGGNTLNALNFSNVTAHTNNTYNGLIFGTGYTNFLSSPTIVIAANGTITGATISGASNTITNIGNGSLTNSSITINSAGILTGGGLVSLGGSLSLTATEADTLASVTGRGATTSTTLTLSSATNSITVGTLTATGGTINGIAIGGSTAASGKFTTLTSTGATDLANAGASNVTIATTGTGTVAIGNSTGTFALTSNSGLNVSTTGGLTGVASLDTITTSSTALTFAGIGTLASTGANALNLNGAPVNINTANTNNTSIGNSTGTVALTGANAVLTTGGSLTLGLQGTTQGGLVFADTAGAGLFTTLKASNTTTAAVTYILPTSDGSSGQVLQTDGGVSTGVLSWVSAGACTTCLVQIPTGNTANTAGNNVISPTAASVVGLTINGTTNATSADVLKVVSGVPSGTSTNGILFNQNSAGTTTNGIDVTRTSGTLTNGLIFNGTIGTDITSAAARALTINPGTTGALNLATANTGNVSIGNSTGTFALTSNTLSVSTLGAITGATGINSTGTINFGTLSINSAVYTDGSKNLTSTAPTSGALGYWTRTGTTLTSTAGSDAVTVGGLLTGSAGITVTGATANINSSGTNNTAIGNSSGTLALASTGLNVTTAGVVTIPASTGRFDVASAGTLNLGTTTANNVTLGNTTGATQLNFNSGTGTQTFASSVATTSGTSGAFAFTANSLTSGTGAYFSSGSITTGDLLAINATGTTLTSGNLFNIMNNSSSVFSVSGTSVTTSLPANFTAPGDISAAYDIQFTNPTASYIKSSAPIYIASGETFNSSNLTLRTYNVGNILLDSGTSTTGTGLVGIGPSVAPVALLHVSNINESLPIGKALALFDQGEAQNIIAASSSGVPKFSVDNSGNIKLAASSGLDVLAAGNLNIGTTTATSVTIGRSGQAVILGNVSSGSAPSGGLTVSGAIAVGNIGTAATNGRIWIRSGNTNFRFNSVAATLDYSEYLQQSTTSEPGDLMVFSNNSYRTVDKSSIPYDQNVLGVVTQYGTGYADGCVDDPSCGQSYDPHYANVGMLGQVYTKVSTENGNIAPGDPITTSSIPGVAMKATKAGRIVGHALDAFNGSASGKDLFDLPTYPVHQVNGKNVGKIIILLQASWYDPSAPAPDNTDNILVNNQDGNGKYALTDSNGNGINSEVIVAQDAAIANLKVGGLTVDTLTATKINASQINGLDTIVNLAVTNQLNQILNFSNNALTIASSMKVLGSTEFDADTLFGGTTTFNVTPIFNNDTAGFAVIKQDADAVEISFDQEYASIPVVSASPVWNVDKQTLDGFKQLGFYVLPKQDFIVANVTTKGFTILLDTKAVTDLNFSWVALAVKDAKTIIGTPAPTPTPTPSPIPSPSPSPVVSPTPSPTP
ncbi:hypothetical protein BH10PAT1_BH10PAT1_2890 [soil metagenome]